MIRSMYSAISGLRNHQTMMDVVGNNIANVNTNGFKGSTATFTDVLSQTLANGGAPGAMGGTNPAQVGLGSALGGITTSFSQGSLQRSGRNTDFAIQGDGFFVLEQGGVQMFTRGGSFSLDADGNLVTNEGGFVQGWTADVNGNVNTNGPVGPITVPAGALIAPVATQNVTMTGNLPADAADLTTVSSSINVYDAQGNASQLNLAFTKQATVPPADDAWEVTIPGAPPTVLGDVTFDPATGAITSGTLTVPAGAVTAGPIDVNLAAVTQYGAAGASILARGQDGAAPGTLQSFSVGRDGVMIGTYSNGKTQAVGQLATATFANPQGLEKVGSSQFRSGANSGAAEIGAAGTGGRGILLQGALEMSNVDLAQEFTNLIVAQRGFQANSRVITTSDEMLQEVVNLKR